MTKIVFNENDDIICQYDNKNQIIDSRLRIWINTQFTPWRIHDTFNVFHTINNLLNQNFENKENNRDNKFIKSFVFFNHIQNKSCLT